jgi:hypothetical protein
MGGNGMRLIDADALRASAMQATETNEVSFNNCFPYWQFSKCIKEAPTIDAMPVVRGEWEFVNDYESKCTACNKNEVVDHAEEPKYCPNCGAKMEGKQ